MPLSPSLSMKRTETFSKTKNRVDDLRRHAVEWAAGQHQDVTTVKALRHNPRISRERVTSEEFRTVQNVVKDAPTLGSQDPGLHTVRKAAQEPWRKPIVEKRSQC
mmetsp:Transcript_660/g.1764  ORF Transcript_660/g.1764 Transcript_660/m.1764 type:complete len:105 (-) Transcript_660:697-1011(-)